MSRPWAAPGASSPRVAVSSLDDLARRSTTALERLLDEIRRDVRREPERGHYRRQLLREIGAIERELARRGLMTAAPLLVVEIHRIRPYGPDEWWPARVLFEDSHLIHAELTGGREFGPGLNCIVLDRLAKGKTWR